jgi:large subunit ribosomal protein L6
MSRIGKRPVTIPSGVSAEIADGTLTVKGPKGTLTLSLREEISYAVDGDAIQVKPGNASKQARAFWGMQRTLVDNLVTGVTQGYTKILDITGVGYRANVQGNNTTIEISGIDKQKVGQVAAEIRRWRKPEPYKGKGIKYRGEFIFRKEGKKK